MLYMRRTVAIVLGFLVALLLLSRPTTLKHAARYYYRAPSGRASDAALNATLGFQKIFVINLPYRSDRRDAMTLAGALTGLKFDWVDGRTGSDVQDKVLPADSIGKTISAGNKGSWRAHMNALRTIVEQNLTSALILEDDADWDVRITNQMRDFAEMSRAYLQPLEGETGHTSVGYSEDIAPKVLDLDVKGVPNTLPPRATPFGDDWDILWLGHCGNEFPARPSIAKERQDGSLPGAADGTPDLPLLRIVSYNDDTVPVHKYLKPHPFAYRDQLAEDYPNHTRVAHASNGTLCTIGYAVSQQGARKLLWQFGLESFTTGWDLMLSDWCDRLYEKPLEGKNGEHGGHTADRAGGRGGVRPPVCLTVQPPLFGHHYGRGGVSDITAPGGGFISKEKAVTQYIRLSVRLNMARLVRGDAIGDLIDQWPDGEEES